MRSFALVGVLSQIMKVHQQDPTHIKLKSIGPTINRSLFSLGLMCRHFDFDSDDFGDRLTSVKDKVFDVLMYFIDHESEEVRHKALCGIGRQYIVDQTRAVCLYSFHPLLISAS